MASGVFGLRKVYKKQVENVTNNNFASWPESGIYGYFAGGFDATATPTSLSKIDRIDFSNETISVPGTNLSAARYVLGSLSNSSYGYYAGGQAPPPYVATIDRIDFTNETTSTPGNDLSQTRGYLEGVSNNSYGYFGGGLGTGPTVFATVERIDLFNETISSPGNNLPQARYALGATASDSYGYFGGGATPTYLATVDRIDFANETTSTPGKNLPQSRGYMGAASSANYGYYGGGLRTPGPTTVATVDRIDFSTEIGSAPGNNLPHTRYGLTATSNNNYGYFGGGFTSPPPARHSTIDRVDFSNETTSAPGNNLSQIRSGSTAISGGASIARANGYGTYGYHAGGWGPPYQSSVTRHDFSSNTFSDVGVLPGPRGNMNRSSYNNFYSYFGGGYGQITPSPSADRSLIYRFDFMSESVTEISSTLPSTYNNFKGNAQTSTREVGYFGGGGFSSYINKIDFSTENVTLVPNRLSNKKQDMSIVRTPEHGYFGGGYTQVPGFDFFSSVDRMDFSTEVVSSYGNMNRVRYSYTSLETRNYGYLWGGSGPNASTYPGDAEKLEFSSGTFSNLSPGVTGPQPYYKSQNSNTDHSFYGYFFGGGFQPYPISGSFGETLVRRLDFSSDTVSTLSPNIPRKAGISATMSNVYE